MRGKHVRSGNSKWRPAWKTGLMLKLSELYAFCGQRKFHQPRFIAKLLKFMIIVRRYAAHRSGSVALSKRLQDGLAALTWLQQQGPAFYASGTDKLITRCDKFLHCYADYIEK